MGEELTITGHAAITHEFKLYIQHLSNFFAPLHSISVDEILHAIVSRWALYRNNISSDDST
jgi:hypothetical protein